LKIINFIYVAVIAYSMRKEIKENILALAIAVIFVFFIGVGIKTFYDLQDESKYCNIDYSANVSTENLCIGAGGKWNVFSPSPPKGDIQGYCDVGFYCRETYQKMTDVYNRNVFIIACVIGILVIFVSLLLKKEAVKTGLMGGGVLTIIYGIIRYWTAMQSWVRFIALGVVLIFLIWIGYKKIEEGQNAKSKKSTEKAVNKKTGKRKK